MQFVKEECVVTLEVKQSKFIAHLIPFSQYSSKLEQLKLQHPKARHFVVAYRYLNEYDQVVEYSTDDGEPSGTSGKPSLMVLQGEEIINAAVIVVRYFGGTKLGTGGLVRAYSDAVNLAVQEARLIQYQKERSLSLIFDYADVRVVEYECKKFDMDILHKDFDSRVVYKIKGTQESVNELLKELERVVEVA